MKANKFSAATGLIVSASIFMMSCIQKNYYNVAPNNTNNNNPGNNAYYSYTFDEEFNGADIYGWSFTDPADSAYASISNGSYEYVDYSAVKSNMSVVSSGANTSGNFTVQARLQSNNIMGLIIGASSVDNGYAFYIDTAGHYSLYKEGNAAAASTIMIASTADSLAINKGWNTLEVDQLNGNWTGYINGSWVFTMAAPALSGASFGFKVLPATVGYADYLIVQSTQ